MLFAEKIRVANICLEFTAYTSTEKVNNNLYKFLHSECTDVYEWFVPRRYGNGESNKNYMLIKIYGIFRYLEILSIALHYIHTRRYSAFIHTVQSLFISCTPPIDRVRSVLRFGHYLLYAAKVITAKICADCQRTRKKDKPELYSLSIIVIDCVYTHST